MELKCPICLENFRNVDCTTHKLCLSILKGTICLFCNNKTELVSSTEVYGKNYGLLYLCRNCNAYCGVHTNTTLSKGTTADTSLRALRIKTHKYFDILWKKNIYKNRKVAYNSLAQNLGIPFKYCHIAMFNTDLCVQTIEWSLKQISRMNTGKKSKIEW